MRKFNRYIFIIAFSSTIPLILAQEAPTYDFENRSLIIPSVNSDGVPGTFQNVEIEFWEGNLWRLDDYWEAVPFSAHDIVSVNLIQVDSNPVQVFLRISGFHAVCVEPGQVSQLREGNTIKIYFYYLENLYFKSEEPVACAAASDEYEKIIPLEVYGLEAGEYEYILNGEFSGTFSLSSDNLLLE